jgi:hypothetical protein
MAVLPLLAFNTLWPPLAANDVAGSLVSALAMAGAVYQLWALVREWRISLLPRLVLVAVFALNPMIIYYAGNGMSEGLYLFTMVATVRYLIRYVRHDDLRSLVYAASFLGLGYLDRTEPIAAAVLAAPIVFGLAYAKSDGIRHARTMAGLTDMTIFLMPIVTAAVGWAVTSYVIVGNAFEQLSSQYGNSSLIAQSGIKPGHYGARLLFEGKSVEYYMPLIAIIVVAAALVAAYRRDVQILVIVAVLGGGLAFNLVSYLDNTIFPFFRYFILMVPLAVILVANMLAVPERARRPRSNDAVHKAMVAIGSAVVAVVLLVPSVPATAAGMFNPNIGSQEVQEVGFIFAKHPDANQLVAVNTYKGIAIMTRSIDAMHLPAGSIVVNNANECIPDMIMRVSDPKVFVIPNDRDFQRILDDPLTFDAHYLLVPDPVDSPADSIDNQYPRLYAHGGGFAHLVTTFKADGSCVTFRLYQVTGHPLGTF